MPRTASRIVALALLAACGEGTADGPGAEEGAALPVLEPTVVERIGSIDDPEQALTRVGQVLIGPDERLYVAQPASDQIRMYGVGGELLGTIGRSGEGPGEFGSVGQMGFAGDTLYVADGGLGRVTFFDLVGAVRSSTQWATEMMRTDEGVAYLPAVPQVRLDDGSGLVQPGRIVAGTMATGPQPRVRTSSGRTPYFRVDAEGAVVDTVVWIESSYTRVRVGTGDAEMNTPCPLADNPLAELMPDGSGVVLVDRRAASTTDPASFRLTLFSPTGDTTWSRAVPYDPAPLPLAELRSRAEEIRETRLQNDRLAPTVAEFMDGYREAECIPATWMPVTALTVTQDGRIWLRREEMGGDAVPWNVLSPGGEPVAQVRLPTGQTVEAASGDLLVTTETDELDVPYLVVYRLAG